MNTSNLFKASMLAIALAAAGLAGCQADADGSRSAGPNGNGTAPITPGVDEDDDGVGDVLPNDGSTDSTVTDGGENLNDGTDGDTTGDPIVGNFICTQSAQVFYGASTDVGTGGLVGGPLTDLLDTLGGASVTALLNSVRDAALAIDGTLDTASTFVLTADVLGLLDSVDQIINLPNGARVEAGNYAVAALTFPGELLDITLGASVRVITYLNGTLQEEMSIPLNDLDLLGLGEAQTFVGIRTKRDYDQVVVSLDPGLLSVSAGEAMKLHEMCTGGRIVAVP